MATRIPVALEMWEEMQADMEVADAVVADNNQHRLDLAVPDTPIVLPSLTT